LFLLVFLCLQAHALDVDSLWQRGRFAEGAMSNFIIGIVAGFFLCVWALDANPVAAAIALIDRVRQVEVSFAAEAEKDARREDASAESN
jgi:hypothetical protein